MCPFSTCSFHIGNRIIWAIFVRIVYIVLWKSSFDQWCHLFTEHININIDLYFSSIFISTGFMPSFFYLFFNFW